MTRDRNVRFAVAGKNVVKHSSGPDILVHLRLAVVSLPELVGLGKTRLDLVLRKSALDIRFGASAIAGMSADTLTEEFLDRWYEGVPARKVESTEGEIGSGETSSQWTSIVALRCRDFLVLDFRGPKGVDGQSLGNAFGCQASIGPGHGAVAIEL